MAPSSDLKEHQSRKDAYSGRPLLWRVIGLCAGTVVVGFVGAWTYWWEAFVEWSVGGFSVMDFNSGLKFLAFVALVAAIISGGYWIVADEQQSFFKTRVFKRYFWISAGLFVALGFLVALGVGAK